MSFVKKLREYTERFSQQSSGSLLSDDLLLDPSVPAEAKASELISLHGVEETMKIMFPRASSLYSACMRQHVLCTRATAEVTSVSSLSSRLIFGFGNAVHFWLQNSPDILGENRIGWWKCSACGRVLYFGGAPKYGCKYCGAGRKAVVYKEHFMKINRRFKVTGHPDMFFRTQRKKILVLEFKTIEGSAFESLKAPLIEHVWQVGTYVRFLREDERLPVEVDGRYGAILYISKRFKVGQFPAKLFIIELTSSLSQRIEEKLEDFVKGLEETPKWLPPPHHDCKMHSFRSYRAKTCPCLQECLQYEESSAV